MNSNFFRLVAIAVATAAASPAMAGILNQTPGAKGVPVDSPWALAGLGALVAVASARLLINRRK